VTDRISVSVNKAVRTIEIKQK